MRDRSRIAPPLTAALLTLTFLLVPGCGYSTQSLMLEGVKTVSVDVVSNDTFRRDLEFILTADLKAAILSRTDLRIVEKEQADVALSGTIRRVREQVLQEDEVDNIVESSLITTVEFTALNRLTGEDKTVTLSDRAEFLTGRNEDINSATQESYSELAEKLVYNLLERGFRTTR